MRALNKAEETIVIELKKTEPNPCFLLRQERTLGQSHPYWDNKPMCRETLLAFLQVSFYLILEEAHDTGSIIICISQIRTLRNTER